MAEIEIFRGGSIEQSFTPFCRALFRLNLVSLGQISKISLPPAAYGRGIVGF